MWSERGLGLVWPSKRGGEAGMVGSGLPDGAVSCAVSLVSGNAANLLNKICTKSILKLWRSPYRADAL